MFNKNSDYKTELKEVIDKLTSKQNEKVKNMGIQEVIKIVDSITNEYCVVTGERPDAYQLERLSNLILRDKLNDPNNHRIKHEDEPILSDRMLHRRKRREVSLDALNNMYGSDKRYKAQPLKREKNMNEEIKREFQKSFEIQKKIDNGEI